MKKENNTEQANNNSKNLSTLLEKVKKNIVLDWGVLDLTEIMIKDKN